MEIEGIVLQITTYKEKDAMINVLTNEGVVSFLARGVKGINSKNAPSVNLYTRSIFELNNKNNSNYYSLKTGKIIEDISNLYSNVESMLTLNFLGELVIKCNDESKTSDLYYLFVSSIKKMKEGFDLTTIRLAFISTIIKKMGLCLHVDNCVICQSKKAIVSVSYEEGGLICKNCFDSFAMENQDVDYIKIIRYLFLLDSVENFPLELPHPSSDKVLKDLVMYLYTKAGVRVKSYELIEKIS